MTRPCNDQRELYRQQYRQGQILRSRDLSKQVEDEEQLRWWHNRAVHHAYGIAYGCEAKTKSGPPDMIVVNAGLAYDSFGRPLWFNSAVTVLVPVDLRNQEGTYVLFICQTQKDERAGGHRSDGAWCGETKESGVSTVEFKWKPAREFAIRDGVAIGTVDLGPSGTIHEPVHAGGYRARSDRKPYLINGQTILGQTAWQVWKEPLSARFTRRQFIAWGVQVKIDTRAAGFTGEPMYVAQTAPFVGPFTSYVTSVSEVGFTFRIAIEHNVSELGFLESAEGVEWLSRLRQFVAVKWIGLELMADGLERTR
jgi:hypothetical protein